eukprot:gene2807-4215_t
MNKVFELKNIYISESFKEDERHELYQKAINLGCLISDTYYDDSITHVVLNLVQENEYKMIESLSTSTFVVSKWIEDCHKVGKWIQESPYINETASKFKFTKNKKKSKRERKQVIESSKKPEKPKNVKRINENLNPNVPKSTTEPKKKLKTAKKQEINLETPKKRGRPTISNTKEKNSKKCNVEDVFELNEQSPTKVKKKCVHQEIDSIQEEEEFNSKQFEEFFKRIFSQNEDDQIYMKNELESQVEILNSIQQLLFKEEEEEDLIIKLNKSIKLL